MVNKNPEIFLLRCNFLLKCLQVTYKSSYTQNNPITHIHFSPEPLNTVYIHNIRRRVKRSAILMSGFEEMVKNYGYKCHNQHLNE